MARHRYGEPGENAALAEIARARVLQDAQRAAQTPSRYIDPNGRAAWRGDTPYTVPGGAIDARATLAGRASGFTSSDEWNRLFPRAQVRQAPQVAAVPIGRPDDSLMRAGTNSLFGGGSASVAVAKRNELYQPAFKDASGDITHTVLSKTPGEDRNLDPVYAAKVFRGAGDEKTAGAYEKYASTLDPVKYVSKGGVPFVNPYFNQPSAPAVAGAPSGNAQDVLSGIPPKFDTSVADAPLGQTFGGRAVNTNLADAAPAVAPIPRTPNSTALAAGGLVGRAIATVNDVTSGGKGFNAAGLPIGVKPTPETPIVDVPNLVGDVASGVRGALTDFGSSAGRALASGVSRSQAAGFEQPTKDNPIPTTPTSPVADVDRTDSSIARFGQTDEEYRKNRFAFAGF